MDFFEQFNQLSEKEFLKRLPLDEAKDGQSYVCPCGHGRNGDGIKQGVYHGRLSWHCHGTCGHHWTNFDLACAVLGYDSGTDKAAAVKELKELFGMDGDEKSARAVVKSSRSVDNMDNKKAVTEPKPRTRLYNYCREHYSLKKFVESQGGKWRGLTYETLNAAGCLYHGDYSGYGDDVARASIIFPYDETFYFVRSTVDKERRVPKDAKRKLYIAAPIMLDAVNFVSEGEIDSLSIAQVMKGCGSVAVGGVGNSEMMISELNKRFGDAERKPRFIVCLDNDKGGRDNVQKFVDKLRSAGYPAVFSFLEENSSDKCDANDLLHRGKLAARLYDVLEDKESELDEQAATLPAKAETPAQVDMATDNPASADVVKFGRSISEYFTEKFFRDVELTKKYAERKTGFENLDEKLVLVPGLFVIGGLPATGKTTFAWQLLNQLADNGELCIYCSYEMSELELFTKSLARKLFERDPARSKRLDLTSFNIRRGHVTHYDEIQSAAKLFSSSKETKLRVAELSNEPVPKLINQLKPLVANVDKSPVIVLDYLQILPAASVDAKRESIDDTLRRLKDFQRESASTFLVISSFNRANYWSPVTFESFKESGGIEYSADAVLGLETFVQVKDTGNGDKNREARKKAITDAYKQDTRTVKLSCLKNRNGGAFDCFFDYHCKFDCFEPTGEPISDDDAPPEKDLVDVT